MGKGTATSVCVGNAEAASRLCLGETGFPTTLGQGAAWNSESSGHNTEGRTWNAQVGTRRIWWHAAGSIVARSSLPDRPRWIQQYSRRGGAGKGRAAAASEWRSSSRPVSSRREVAPGNAPAETNQQRTSTAGLLAACGRR